MSRDIEKIDLFPQRAESFTGPSHTPIWELVVANIGYDGPCPPYGHGTHHYHFTLHAVADRISLPNGAVVAQLQAALSETTISTSDLIGTYAR